MISIKKTTTIFAIAISSMVISPLFGQSYNEAATLYNEGIGVMKADVALAIESFEACIKMCDEVGDSALDLRTKAGNVVADLYFQKAYRIYSIEKKVPEAIEAAQEAIIMCEKYNNERSKEKTEKFLVQLYAINGSNSFKEKNYENAIIAFDNALKINPDYTAAIFNKALVYKAMDDIEQFAPAIDLFIEKTSAANDTAQVSKGQKLALDYFRVAGNKANQANNLNDAANLLTSALKYGEDKDVCYALANVLNKQKKYDEALANAEKGLTLETGNAEAKAKFYYELAVAQAGKGDIETACQSFINARYGVFVEASKAQITNLKCGQ